MHKTALADSTILIVLSNIKKLDLLNKIYEQIHITSEIYEECSLVMSDWIIVQKIKDKKYQKFLETQFDVGEASLIALSQEYNTPLLLDDLKARKLAKRLGLKVTGTSGIIQKAKEFGYIAEVKPIIEELHSNGFYLSSKITNEFLRIN
jgi:predicted nucleic acid-binding protein